MSQRTVMFLLVSTIVMATVGLGGCSLTKSEAIESFDVIVDTGSSTKLVVNNAKGDIEVLGNERSKVSIGGRVTAQALSVQRAQKLVNNVANNPPVKRSANGIVIDDTAKYPVAQWKNVIQLILGPSLSINYEINTPTETQLKVTSNAGSQFISGISGPVTLSNNSGQVRVENVDESVEISVNSGSIHAQKVGVLEAETGSGEINASRIRGNFEGNTGSGSISLTQISGNVEAGSNSGKISIHSDVASSAEWILETNSGNIEIYLPDQVEFRIDARTNSGTITTQFDLTAVEQMSSSELVGNIGHNPTGRIVAETSSGNISIVRE